jgi:hypothetical protein
MELIIARYINYSGLGNNHELESSQGINLNTAWEGQSG